MPPFIAKLLAETWAKMAAGAVAALILIGPIIFLVGHHQGVRHEKDAAAARALKQVQRNSSNLEARAGERRIDDARIESNLKAQNDAIKDLPDSRPSAVANVGTCRRLRAQGTDISKHAECAGLAGGAPAPGKH